MISNPVPTIRHLLYCVLILATAASAQECERFEALMRAAADGDKHAEYEVGESYEFGLCTEPDLDKAMYWYFLAAGHGSKDAIYSLGLAFYTGIGMQKNIKVADLFFARAAANGHQSSIVMMINSKVLRFPGCNAIPEIESLIEKVSDEGAKVLIDYARFSDLREMCAASEL